MARKFNGVLQYFALFVIVFILAIVFFAIVFGIIFPSDSLTEGPISPYYSDSTSANPALDITASEADTKEASKIISVYSRMNAEEKMHLYSIFSSKLSESEIKELYSMASDGVDESEREYFNSLAAARLTAAEISELYSIYQKYA